MYIEDERRKRYMNAVQNRIREGKSVLIYGRFGCGKSEFIRQIETPQRCKRIEIESLASVHVILGTILETMGIADFSIKPPSAMHKSRYLQAIKGIDKKYLLIIDEANDLKKQTWPYLKRIMDAGVSIILSGKPKIIQFLENNHKDILSRLKLLPLVPVGPEDFKAALPDFDPLAVEIIYGEVNNDIRKMTEELIPDCRNYITANNYEKVTPEVANMFCDALFEDRNI